MIEEQNKRIAKFMGGTTHEDTKDGSGKTISWDCKELPFLHGKICNPKALKFHEDWNWLMPVLHQIRKINDEVFQPVRRVPRYATTPFLKVLNGHDIKEVHYSVVEFIDHYTIFLRDLKIEALKSIKQKS